MGPWCQNFPPKPNLLAEVAKSFSVLGEVAEVAKSFSVLGKEMS